MDIHIMDAIIHDMSARRPTLLPLLRSQNQLRLLTALLLNPTCRYTVGELATATGVPQPSVSREVRNLLTTGVVSGSEERGRRVFGADTESPIFPELASLVLKTSGPQAVLEEVLSRTPGIEEAHVYGSWARRYHGQHGSQPQDIDLLVVGEPDVADVRRRADLASDRLGRDVSVAVLTPGEWASAASGFVHQVRTSPLVRLDLTAKSSSCAVAGAAT